MFVYASHVLSEVSHELRTVEASSFVSSSKSTFWLILPFLLLFGSFEPFLKIFSYKKFSRVVVYCSVINVLRFRCSQLQQQLCYSITSFRTCQELFEFYFLLSRFSLSSQLIHISIFVISCQELFQENLILFFETFNKYTLM